MDLKRKYENSSALIRNGRNPFHFELNFLICIFVERKCFMFICFSLHSKLHTVKKIVWSHCQLFLSDFRDERRWESSENLLRPFCAKKKLTKSFGLNFKWKLHYASIFPNFGIQSLLAGSFSKCSLTKISHRLSSMLSSRQCTHGFYHRTSMKIEPQAFPLLVAPTTESAVQTQTTMVTSLIWQRFSVTKISSKRVNDEFLNFATFSARFQYVRACFLQVINHRFDFLWQSHQILAKALH